MARNKKGSAYAIIIAIVIIFTVLLLIIKSIAKDSLKILGFSQEERTKWNPHKVELNKSESTIEKKNDVIRFHLLSKADRGHLASGFWKLKEPHFSLDSRVTFEVRMTKAINDIKFERCAVACAIRSPKYPEQVKYVELDYWRGQNTDKEEIISGFEYPIDQLPLGTWTHFNKKFKPYIEKSWDITEGYIESIYIVMEVDHSESTLELEFRKFAIHESIPKEIKVNA